MADLEKVKEYQQQLQILRMKDDSPVSVLLGLLRAYADIPAADAFFLARAGLAVSRKLHDRSYQKYIDTILQSDVAADLTAANLNEFIAVIDAEISGEPEQRAKYQITKPHDEQGHFQVMWIAFFIVNPEVYKLDQIQVASSILKTCRTEADNILDEVDHTKSLGLDVAAVISQHLTAPEIAAASKTSRHMHGIFTPSRERGPKRLKLLKLVEQDNPDNLEAIKTFLGDDISLLADPQLNPKQSAIHEACYARRKDKYDILVAPVLKQYPKLKELLDFHYLVIGGQRIEAEAYLTKYKTLDEREHLIFDEGIFRLSAMSLSALEGSKGGDVEMRARFCRQLHSDPESIAKEYKATYARADLATDEAKWDEYYYDVLMKDLDQKYKTKADAHISKVLDNPRLMAILKQADEKYQATYKKAADEYYRKSFAAGDKAWYKGVGGELRKRPRCEVYESFRQNLPYYTWQNPIELLRTGYEREPAEMQYIFGNGDDLFDRNVYKELGHARAVFLGVLDGAATGIASRHARGTWGGGGVERAELNAVTRVMEVRQQKFKKELIALGHQLESAPTPKKR